MTTEFFRRVSKSACIALAGAALALAGCAAQETRAPTSVEPKIESVGNRVDHEALAIWYEGQAGVNAAAAKRHQSYAATYRKNISPKGEPEVHLALAVHCENLARTYEQAADQNLALARLHRGLADQGK